MNAMQLTPERFDDLGRAGNDGQLRRQSAKRGDGIGNRRSIALAQDAQRLDGLSVLRITAIHEGGKALPPLTGVRRMNGEPAAPEERPSMPAGRLSSSEDGYRRPRVTALSPIPCDCSAPTTKRIFVRSCSWR